MRKNYNFATLFQNELFVWLLYGGCIMDFLQQLKQYFADTSPEQLEKDYEELREFNNIGPTVDEYLQCVGDIQEIRISEESILNLNPEFSLDFLYIIK